MPADLKNTFSSLLIVGCLLYISCGKKNADTANGSSIIQNKIVDSADSILNVGGQQHAIKYLDSAYAIFKNPGAIDLWRKYEFKVRYYSNYEKDIPVATKYVDSMFSVLAGKELQYKNAYASTLFAKGDILQAYYQYAQAYKYYYDGRAFTRKYLDSCSSSEVSNRLGLLEYSKGNYLKVIPYMKEAILESENCPQGNEQNLYDTIALSFDNANMPDSAIYYYQMALASIKKKIDPIAAKRQYATLARGVIYGNMGGVYIKMKNYRVAEKYLLSSVAINNRPGYAVVDAQTAREKLADLYLQTSRLPEAAAQLKALKEFIDKASPGDTKTLRVLWLNFQSRYLKQTGRFRESLAYFQRYSEIKDSVHKVREQQRSNDIDIVFKNNEQEYQLALLNKNDTIKTFYLTAVIVFSGMAIVILLIVWFNLKRTRKNVTELKNLNRQMEKALNALEQSQEENSRLLRVVAHDLRSPIGSMYSLATMVLSSPELAENDRPYLEMIKISGKNCIDLVSDLLEEQFNRDALKTEMIDLAEMLNHSVAQLTNKAEDKKQRLVLHAHTCIIPASQEKLWRVTNNLIGNAIKFSPEGATITITLEEKANSALIAVKDNGIGIPAELNDKIFKMFTNAARTGTAGEKPFGMGLAISKQIVEAHGGKLWFESEPGHGTTFYVELLRGDN